MGVACHPLPRWAALLALLAVVSLGQFRASASDSDAPPSDEASKGDASFQLGNMIEPFDPPSLAELDAKADWVDRPVRSGIAQMRKRQEEAGPTPITVDEALALRNTSPENNEKILATLGRLAPSDGAGVNYGTTWVRHVSGDMRSSNPLLMSSVTEFEYQALTAFWFLAYDKELSYFAPQETVVSWQTSKDAMMDKFVLRDDLVWSDGKPITAHDVVFTFRVLMSDAVPIPALRTGTDQLRWIEAYDDRTFVVFHKQALATNTLNLGFPTIPKHIYEKSLAEDPRMTRSAHHTRLEDHPVVGGAYELVSRRRNQEFVLRRRENYYMRDGKQVRPKPYFKELRVKVIEDVNTALVALKAGQIEEMMLRPEQWVSQTEDEDFYRHNTKVTALEWTEFHFVWNIETPFFSDRRVREAMSWAVDYDELLKVVCQGLYQPAQGVFHPSSWMFPKNGPQPYRQDFTKAEKLLAEAGWTDSDGDGILDKEIDGQRVPFEFTMLTYQTETGLMAATLMKASLDQIGIVCNVKPTEFTVLIASVQKHQFEAAMGGWGSGTDPFSVKNIFGTGEARNYGSYSNKQVDELFEQGLHELDTDKRAEIYGQIHEILWKDQPYTWLFYRNAFYAFSKKLRGYNFAPTGPYLFDPGISSIYKPDAM